MPKIKMVVLATALSVSIMVLVGCSSDKSSVEKPEGTASKIENKVEMFSWWTGDGEVDGLNKMLDIYKSIHPKVDVVNATVAGGAGSNAKAVLKARMMGGDPPDSFQVHAGQEISGWVNANKMEIIDDLYISEEWSKVFPKDLLDILKVNGHFYSVPVNIHRSNVIWYSKKLFAENGLTVPKTYHDFFLVAEVFKKKNIIPLALGDNGQWADLHIFESILLATMGQSDYNGLWTGKTDWKDKSIREALETFKRMLEYVNPDHTTLAWDQAAQMVIDGKAAMTMMGDWVDGYFNSKKFAEYGWQPSPGTDGTFLMLSDSFGIPKGAKNPKNAKEWLKLCGSKEGQDAFNPLKGSIPARIDAGIGNYDAYLKSAMKDWASNTLSPSVAHGAAANEGWMNELITEIGIFVAKKDVEASVKVLSDLAMRMKEE